MNNKAEKLEMVVSMLNEVDFTARIAEEYPLVKAIKEAFVNRTTIIKKSDGSEEPCISLTQFNKIVEDLKSEKSFWPIPWFAGSEDKENRFFIGLDWGARKGRKWFVDRKWEPVGEVSVTHK